VAERTKRRYRREEENCNAACRRSSGRSERRGGMRSRLSLSAYANSTQRRAPEVGVFVRLAFDRRCDDEAMWTNRPVSPEERAHIAGREWRRKRRRGEEQQKDSDRLSHHLWTVTIPLSCKTKASPFL
jgi:hypothetical protein